MKKLRLREFENLPSGHTAHPRQGWDVKPARFRSKALALKLCYGGKEASGTV